MRSPAGDAGDRLIPVKVVVAAARGRANRRLERARRFPIAIVAAPAGYGRSTVVHDHLRACGARYRLVEIDAFDDGILGLLRALAAALGDVLPGFASSFVGVYDRLAQEADAAANLATWAAAHFESLDTTIVVDERNASADERVAAFLSLLIEQTCARVRWIVIAGRSDQFPVARWMAEGRTVMPLDDADLGLTLDDLRAARRSVALALSDEQLRQLCARSGGRPADVGLALGADDAAFDEWPIGVAVPYAHLAHRALGALSEADRAFVETTCLFDAFDAALLECAGLADRRETIALLADDLAVLTVSGDAYRYDELFAAFVRADIVARRDGSFERLAAIAAAAYERDGRFAAALAVHVERRDHAAIGEVLSAHGFRLIDRGESTAVARSLEALPHEVLVHYPAALAVKASLESLHGKFDVAEAWFRLALGAVTDEPQRYEIAYRFGIDLVRRERFDAIELLAPNVRSIAQDAPLAAPLWALLATAYASHRRFIDASTAIARALALLPRVADPGSRAKIIYQAGFVALSLRDIESAKSLARQAHGEAAATFSYDVAARALSVAYNIAVDYDDDVGASRRYLEQLAELSVRAGSRQLLLYATLCRYEIEALSGASDEIARLEQRLQSLDVFFSVLTTETLLPAQALQATWSGNFYRAYRLLEPSVGHQIDPERQAHRLAEIAIYAAAAGLRHEASTAAERALTLARRAPGVNKTLLLTLTFVALTFVLLRRHARAEKLLAELAAQRGANERIGTFVDAVAALAVRWTSPDAAHDLAGALERLERCDLGGLARMLEALPLPETARSRSARLTASERDVLGLLAGGSTAGEIACRSGRRIERVDAQIASLCRKLGCAERRHAVALALAEHVLYATPDAMPRAESQVEPVRLHA